VLAEKNETPQQIVEAKKEKITADAAWDLLGAAQEVIVGQGQKFVIFAPAQDDKETILKACLGRTGNLRAPTLKMGNLIVVGFNNDMYEQFVK
jgi:hypothetical protein